MFYNIYIIIFIQFKIIYINYSYLFIVFLILLLIISLVTLHIKFFIAWHKKRSESNSFHYLTFVKNKLTKRRILTTLIWAPLCFTILIVGIISMVPFYYGHSLQKQLQDSTMLKIKANNFYHINSAGEIYNANDIVLFDTTDKDKIKGLIKRISFSFQPGSIGARCACRGEMTFKFYDKNAEILRVFGFHHNSNFRFKNILSSDFRLSSRAIRLFDDWLTQNGIRQKQKELAKEQEKLFEERKEQIDN